MHDYALSLGHHPHRQGNSTNTSHPLSRLVTAHFVAVTAFVDYAENVHAQEELKKLRMKEGNVDKYVATFELLGQRARGDLDDPFLLTIFARGLPKALADACIDMETPETFQEWKAAALCQQKNWMRKQALHHC